MKTTEENNHRTIFDDVFRTMEEKMPQFIIPVINEVFGTSYSEEEAVECLRNEHITPSGRIITDSCFKIQKFLYHVECQSSPDYAMTIRMVEYDFAIALDRVEKKNGLYEMNFPHSSVLYLRHNRNTSDELKMKVNLPNGESFFYTTPIIKVQDYTKDEIFQKNLIWFLPYYIMKYEKHLEEIKQNPEKMQAFLYEFEDIQNKLEKQLEGEGNTVFFTELIELIMEVSNYILQSEKELQERMGMIMGGKVLELRTDKLLAQGLQQGLQKGENKFARLVSRLLTDGRMQDIGIVAEDVEVRKEFYKMYGITDEVEKELP